MVATIRETIAGLNHLRLKACRRIFKMKEDAFLKRYSRYDVPVEVCRDEGGNPIQCEICGFVLVRAIFADGWQMEMCSALPLVNIDRPAFRQWLTTLAADTNNCQTGDFKPILHDR